MENQQLLSLDIKMPKDKLSQMVSEQYFDVVHGLKMGVNGFQVELEALRLLPISVDAKEKSIFLSLPVKFTFYKPEGLFSIEGDGQLKLNIQILIDILENNTFYFNVDIISYDWVESPKLKLGILNIPIEMIADIVFKKLKEELLLDLEKKLNEKLLITDWLYEFHNKYAYNLAVHKKPDFYLNADLKSLSIGMLRDSAEHIELSLDFESPIFLTDQIRSYKYDFKPTISWKTDDVDLAINSLEADIEVSFVGLSKIIQNQLNANEIGGKKFDVESVHIRNTSFFEVTVNLRSPISGACIITGIPEYNDKTGLLTFDRLKVEVIANNFIYKLSSPFIEKIIRNKIEELLPLNVNEILKEQLLQLQTAKPAGLDLKIGNVFISNFIVASNAIKGVVGCTEFELIDSKSGFRVVLP